MTAGRYRRYGPDIGLTCANLIGALSVVRLLAGGLGSAATGPLLAAAAIGSILPAVLVARHVPVPIRLSTGALAVALMALWSTSPGSTTYGLPTVRTWRALENQLQAAHPIIVGFVLPQPATPGIVLICSLVVGLIAVLASVILHASGRPTLPRPGLALLPPFALLAFVCAETSTRSLAIPIVCFVAAAAFTLLSAQPPLIGAPAAWARLRSPTTALSVSIMAGVILVTQSFGVGGGGVTGTSAGGAVGGRVPVTGLSLTSNLVALEVNDANVVLFHAQSAHPTYWQVAVLNVLRGGVWVAGPPAAATPPGPEETGTFPATVEMAHLSTRFLPVPPATVTVSGIGPITMTAEGIRAAGRSRAGDMYSTISLLPPVDRSGGFDASDASTYPPALVRAEVALPRLPGVIGKLARQATRGAHTPLAQAQALVNWFRSGAFRYTLDPPVPSSGANPLVSFLTATRSGTCEQFAGAFTVLARTLGLPTRLVVGFTAGTRTGRNSVTVRGEDAHAWPEVYLGPAAGWVSFEPTPQQLSGEVVADGVVGPTATPTTTPGVTQPTTTTPTTPTSVTTGTTASSTPKSSSPATHHHERPAPFPWWIPVTLCVALGAVLVILTLLRRRRSSVDRPPVETSGRAAGLVERALRKADVARPAWQPLSVFADELTESLGELRKSVGDDPTGMVDQVRALVADIVAVAISAEHALYDPLPVDVPSATRALAAAHRVRRGLRSQKSRRALSFIVGVQPSRHPPTTQAGGSRATPTDRVG
jgi:hypothetical protein